MNRGRWRWFGHRLAGKNEIEQKNEREKPGPDHRRDSFLKTIGIAIGSIGLPLSLPWIVEMGASDGWRVPIFFLSGSLSVISGQWKDLGSDVGGTCVIDGRGYDRIDAGGCILSDIVFIDPSGDKKNQFGIFKTKLCE